jgi:hypothetical protein
MNRRVTWILPLRLTPGIELRRTIVVAVEKLVGRTWRHDVRA